MDEKELLEIRRAVYDDLVKVYEESGIKAPDFDTFNEKFVENKELQRMVYDDIGYGDFDISFETFTSRMGVGEEVLAEESVGKPLEDSSVGSENTSQISTEPLRPSQEARVATPRQPVPTGEGIGVELPEGSQIIDTALKAGEQLAYLTPEGMEGRVLTPVEITAEREPDRTSVTQRMSASFMAGLNSLNEGIFRTPELIYRISGAILNLPSGILQRMGIERLAETLSFDINAGWEEMVNTDYSVLKLTAEIADYYAQAEQEYSGRLPDEYGDITGAISEGNWASAGEYLASGVINSIPSLALLGATGGTAGAGGIARQGLRAFSKTLPFSGSNMAELQREGVDVPDNLLPIYATMKGMSEIIDANIGASAVLRREISRGLGREQVEQLVKGYLGKVFKANGIPMSVVQGSASEGLVQLTQNIIDKYSGIDPNRNLMDNVANGMIIGGGMTGTMASGGSLSRAIADRGRRKLVKQLEAELADLIEDANKVEGDVLYEKVQDQIEAKTEQLDNEVEQAINEQSNMTEEEISEVVRKNTEEDSLEAELDSERDNLSETTQSLVEGEISPETSDLSPTEAKVPAGSRLFSQPVEGLTELSNSYKEANNVSTPEGQPIRQLDRDRSARIADAYETMEHNPNDPEVKASYEAMATETLQQFETIQDAGYTVELWDGEGEPYANSTAMLEDLRNNKHLYVLPTEAEFGETPITDQQRQENPLLRDSGITDSNGRRMLINDVFRFVHDVFGHGERGNSFGPLGEENAWDVHARMYSDTARRAMTTETRGQNSWVNFGPHLRNAEGQVPRRGEEGFTPATERPFAEQKIGLLPEEFSQLEPVQEQAGQTETPSDTTTEVEVDSTIFENVFDDSKRQSRISELEARIKQQWEDSKNLNIAEDPKQRAKDEIGFIRDLTEYAVLKIADGTINTAKAFRDMAKGIGEFTDETLNRAYHNAVEMSKEYVKTNPTREQVDSAQGNILTRLQNAEIDRTPAKTKVSKKQIREVTAKGIPTERVKMTSKQALHNQIRTLNRGARDAVRNVRQIQQALRDYIKDNKDKFRGLIFTGGELRRLANFASNVTDPKRLASAMRVIDGVLDNGKYRQRMKDISNTQRRVNRISKGKKFPPDWRKTIREFSGINPRHFIPMMSETSPDYVENYLNMLHSLSRAGVKPTDVSNATMAQMVDLANEGKQILDAEAQARAEQKARPIEEKSTKEQREQINGLKTRLRGLGMKPEDVNNLYDDSATPREVVNILEKEIQDRQVEGLKKQLKDLGMNESEVETIINEGNSIDDVIAKLTETVDEIKPTRMDVIKDTSNKLHKDILKNYDEITDNMTPSDKAQLDTLLDLIDLPKLQDKWFLPLNYVLNNIRNNGSISGTTQFIAIFTAIRQANNVNLRNQALNGFRRTRENGKIFSDSWRKKWLATLYVRFEAIVKDTRNIGKIHEFFGYDKYNQNSKRVKVEFQGIKEDIHKILKKWNKKDSNYWQDPYNTVLTGAHTVLAQYRSSWTPERIREEYVGRMQGIAESLDRLRNERKQYATKAYDANIKATEKLVNFLMDVQRDSEGNIIEVTPKVELNEIWEAMPEGYKEHYEYTRKFFDDHKEQFFTVVKGTSKETVETDWENYFPMSYLDYTRREGTSSVNKADVDLTETINSFNIRSTTSPTSDAGISRTIEKGQLPRNKVLNLNLMSNFEVEAGKVLSDIYTLQDKYNMNILTDVRNNGLEQFLTPENAQSALIYRDIITDRVAEDQDMVKRAVNVDESLGKIAKDILSLTGTIRTLGGFSQFAKQGTVISEIMTRLKTTKSMGLAQQMMIANPDLAKRFLEAGDVTLRNQQSNLFSVEKNTASLNKEMEAGIRSTAREMGVTYRDLLQDVGQWSLYPLIKTDKWASDLGWLSLYVDRVAEKNGGKFDPFADIDLDAVAFADNTNSVVSNASDASMQGGYSNSFFKWYQPMMGFSTNSMHNFIVTLSKYRDAFRSGDSQARRRYGAEAWGNLSNAVLFVGMSYATRYAGMKIGGAITKYLIEEYTEDEEEKVELLEVFQNEFDKKILNDRARTINYAMNDMLLRGVLSNTTTPLVGWVNEQLGVQDYLFGKEEIRRSGYSYAPYQSSSSNLVMKGIEDWIPIMGTIGMGIAQTTSAVSNIAEAFTTHEEFIKARNAVVTADGSDIILDDGFLTDEGIAEYGIPTYLRGTNYMAGIAGATSLFGISDQTTGSIVRNMKSAVNSLVRYDRGQGRRGNWEKKLKEDVKSFDSITILKEDVELSAGEMRKYSEMYLKEVVKMRKSMQSEVSRRSFTPSEIETIVASTARELVEAKILTNYIPRLEKEASKQGARAELEMRLRDATIEAQIKKMDKEKANRRKKERDGETDE